MKHVLLFDSACPACSQAARAVAAMGIEGLEVRGPSDPEILARLREAGLESRPLTDRPALLTGEGSETRLVTGWWMRRSLARLVGRRRATGLLRLVSIEARARADRAAGAVTRRRVLGAGLAAAAGAVASTVLPEAASAASVAPEAPASPDALVAPSQGQVRAAMASPSVQNAIRHWGPISPIGVLNTRPSVIIFSFQRISNQTLTVDLGDFLRALAIRKNPGSVQYFTSNGIELGSLSVVRGRVVVSKAPAKGLNRKKVQQFLACIGAQVDAPCVLACESCVSASTPVFVRVVNCVQCLVCAGPKAIQCARLHLG